MLQGSDEKFYTVKDVSAADFIKAYANHLKKNNKLEHPEWLDFVKTGVARQLAPLDEDWIYIRVAAIARKIYLRGHLGVGLMQHQFGGNQNNGVCPEHHRTASGKIIRWGLQQLVKLGVVKKDKKAELKKGSRVITKEGQTDLNRIATQAVLEKREKKRD